MLPGAVIPLQHYLLGRVRLIEICPRVERVSRVHVERIRRAVEVMLMERLRRPCPGPIPTVAAVAVRRRPRGNGIVHNDKILVLLMVNVITFPITLTLLTVPPAHFLSPIMPSLYSGQVPIRPAPV